MSALAGVAILAIDIRLNRTAIPDTDSGHARSNGQHFDSQLVSRNPRVTKKWHFAQIATDIRATHADAMHADQHFPWFGIRCFVDFNQPKLLGLFELNGFHRRCERTLSKFTIRAMKFEWIELCWHGRSSHALGE